MFCEKKVFLEISQNSQENTCARDSFLIKLQACNFIKKESLYRCFPVNFAKFLRTPFLQNTSGQLLLLFPHKTVYSSNNSHNAHKNVDGSSKFILLKIDFLKTTGTVKDHIKVSVTLANKYDVKAKNFSIPISVYGN